MINSKGFSLFELVLTIAIVMLFYIITFSYILPMISDARKASMLRVESAIKIANAQFQGKAIIAGLDASRCIDETTDLYDNKLPCASLNIYGHALKVHEGYVLGYDLPVIVDGLTDDDSPIINTLVPNRKLSLPSGDDTFIAVDGKMQQESQASEIVTTQGVTPSSIPMSDAVVTSSHFSFIKLGGEALGIMPSSKTDIDHIKAVIVAMLTGNYGAGCYIIYSHKNADMNGGSLLRSNLSDC